MLSLNNYFKISYHSWLKKLLKLVEFWAANELYKIKLK